MKNVLISVAVMLCAGCGVNQKTTIGQTTLAMHDLVAIAAPVASESCAKKLIAQETCIKLKTSYDVFRKSWPIVDDALLVYLKSDDAASQQTFQDANAVFIKNYADVLSILVQTGVLKGVK